MRTTKIVGILVLITVMLLSGCSGNDSNSTGNVSATPRAGITMMGTTSVQGNMTGTPEMMGTVGSGSVGIGSVGTSTTPGAMMTPGTTAYPDAKMTSVPGTKTAMDTTGTPTVMATTSTSLTQTTVGTMNATGTLDALGTPTVMATMNATSTVDALGTPTVMATTDASLTQTPVATMNATGTPEAMGTPTMMATATPAVGAAAAVPGTDAAPASLLLLQTSFEQIYTQVNPSVVYIEVVEGSAVNGSGGSGSGMASGSGFVWDSQGHVVTNNHVVAGATSVNVTFVDGTTVAAKVVGQDPNSDLAVLQVTVPASVLHPVKMGDSTLVKVGQIAIAIGNPFGLEGSMSQGIISALARTLPVDTSNQNQNQNQTNSTTGVYNIPNIIQTDAAINPGNSGGVLVNLQGEVIGVTAAIASSSQSNSGVGFVIPAEIVSKVVPGLITNGSYAHPWLGISGRSVDSNVTTQMKLPTTQRGVVVMGLTASGPAATAGLVTSTFDSQTGSITKLGDIITAINGQSIRMFEDLGSYLFLQTKPGDVVTLTVLRDGKEQTIKVTLGTLPTQ